jgi:hypothetical protein
VLRQERGDHGAAGRYRGIWGGGGAGVTNRRALAATVADQLVALAAVGEHHERDGLYLSISVVGAAQRAVVAHHLGISLSTTQAYMHPAALEAAIRLLETRTPQGGMAVEKCPAVRA